MEKMLKTTAKDRVTKTAEHVNGGAGFIMKEELITPEQRGEHCGLLNRITLKPNCETVITSITVKLRCITFLREPECTKKMAKRWQWKQVM